MTVAVSATVGVPDRVRVIASNDSPAGRVADTLYRLLPTPPVAAGRMNGSMASPTVYSNTVETTSMSSTKRRDSGAVGTDGSPSFSVITAVLTVTSSSSSFLTGLFSAVRPIFLSPPANGVIDTVVEPLTSPAGIVSERRMAVYSVSRVAALSSSSVSPSASVSVVTTKTTGTSSSNTRPFRVPVTATSFAPVPALISPGLAVSAISEVSVSSSTMVMVSHAAVTLSPTVATTMKLRASFTTELSTGVSVSVVSAEVLPAGIVRVSSLRATV